MNWVGCYWFFLMFSSFIPHWFIPCLCFALFYTLLIFTPYSFKSVRLPQKPTSALLFCPFLSPLSLMVMFKSLTFHVLFTVGVAGSQLCVLPYLWRLWTSLLCRTRRVRWSALSSSVLSTSWSAQKNKRERERKRGERQQWLLSQRNLLQYNF